MAGSRVRMRWLLVMLPLGLVATSAVFAVSAGAGVAVNVSSLEGCLTPAHYLRVLADGENCRRRETEVQLPSIDSIAQLGDLVDQTSADVDAVNFNIASLSESMSALAASVPTIDDLDAVRSGLADLAARVNDLETLGPPVDFTSFQDYVDSAVAVLQVQIDRKAELSSVDDLTSLVADVSGNVDSLAAYVEGLDSQVADLVSTVTQLPDQTQIDTLDGRLAGVEDAVDGKADQSALDAVTVQVVSLDDLLTAQNAQVQDTQTQVSELAAEVANLSPQITADDLAQITADVLARLGDGAGASVGDLAGQVADMSSQLDLVEASVEMLGAAQDEIQLRFGDLAAQVDALSEASDPQAIASQVEELVQSGLADTSLQLASKADEAEILTLQSQFDDITSQIAQNSDDIAGLRQDVDAFLNSDAVGGVTQYILDQIQPVLNDKADAADMSRALLGIDSVQATVDGLVVQVDDLASKLEMMATVDDMGSLREDLIQYVDLQLSSAATTDETQTLQMAVENLQSQVSDLQGQSDVLTAWITELPSVSDVSNLIEQGNADVADALGLKVDQDDFRSLVDLVDNLAETVAGLTGQIDEIASGLSQFATAADIESGLDAMTAALDQALASKAEAGDVEELASVLQGNLEQFGALIDEVDGLQTQMTAVVAADDLQMLGDDLRAEFASQMSAAAPVDAVESLATAVEGVDALIAGLADQLATTALQVDSMASSSDLQQAIESLTADWDSLASSFASADEVADLTELIAQVQANQADSSAAIAQLSEGLASAVTDEELQAAIASLSSDIQAQLVEFAAASDVAALSLELDRVVVDVTALSETVDSAIVRLDAALDEPTVAAMIDNATASLNVLLDAKADAADVAALSQQTSELLDTIDAVSQSQQTLADEVQVHLADIQQQLAGMVTVAQLQPALDQIADHDTRIAALEASVAGLTAGAPSGLRRPATGAAKVSVPAREWQQTQDDLKVLSLVLCRQAHSDVRDVSEQLQEICQRYEARR